ncbi:MAG: DUF2851 family protein [Fluviicola sp.]|nr:DUF2851 family protein [Fluviicola sp.]
MTEKYLHFIWKNKRFPSIDVQLFDERKATILNVGEHNENNSGPDFKLGAIEIENVALHGHIELHVRSSDWYRHKHHEDENYNNVILHVVYINDKQIIQNGVKIPTLELKHYIDENHYRQFIRKQLRSTEFPCEHQINKIDPFFFNYMKIRALTDKLNEKVRTLKQMKVASKAEALYHLLGQAFGTSINKLPFSNLLQKVPYSVIEKIPAIKRYNLVLSESGIIQQQISSKYQQKNEWHYKGTRPKNFPSIRVRQFALLAEKFDFETSLQLLSVEELKLAFSKMLTDCWQDNLTIEKLSKSFINHLLINAIAPFLWFSGELDNNSNYQEKAMDLLSILPPEKNNVIRKWNKIKVEASSAFDTQALLAMHRYYCCHKKCLSCNVGKKVLNRTDK